MKSLLYNMKSSIIKLSSKFGTFITEIWSRKSQGHVVKVVALQKCTPTHDFQNRYGNEDMAWPHLNFICPSDCSFTVSNRVILVILKSSEAFCWFTNWGTTWNVQACFCTFFSCKISVVNKWKNNHNKRKSVHRWCRFTKLKAL